MKYLKKQKKKKWPIILAVIGFAVVFGLLGWIILADPEKPQDVAAASDTQMPEQNTGKNTEPSVPAITDEVTQPTETTTNLSVSMPYSLAGGKLTVDAVFQYTGMNPDKQDEWAENVAAIQITNASEEHLAFATVTVTTMDGIMASFTIYDIPAGRSAMVFSPDNIEIENNPECAQITGDAVFLPQSPLERDKLQISVEGVDITLENTSGEDLSRITVYCHSMLDQSCYGGMVYSYQVDSLPAGETTLVSAWECILGMVEVVRVEIGAE